jgi:hypothetical protein
LFTDPASFPNHYTPIFKAHVFRVPIDLLVEEPVVAHCVCCKGWNILDVIEEPRSLSIRSSFTFQGDLDCPITLDFDWIIACN